MRTLLVLSASLALALSSASAAPADSAVRALVKADKALRAGALLEKAATGKRKMANLKRADLRYRAARRIARSALGRADKVTRLALEGVVRNATAGRVRVLLTEARTFWGRGAVSSARKRVRTALKLVPADTAALDLKRRIENKIKGTPDYDYQPGVTARRAARDQALGLNHRQRVRRRVPSR